MCVAIEIDNLTKFYGKNRGIEGVSISVKEGDIYGFLGPNGAGKSTTIRCLLGMLHYDEGKIQVLGKDTKEHRVDLLRDIGYMPSEAMFYPSMRVDDVIKFAAKTRGVDCSREAKRLCDLLEVDLLKKISDLSLGNRKKISVVCAMQHMPRLLILDEPTSGLDPLMQEAFFDLILERNKKGSTIFMSSHVLPEVKKYCNNTTIIKEGNIICTDSVAHLTKSGLRRIHIEGVHELSLSGMKDVCKGSDYIDFSYTGAMSELIKDLQGKDIRDLRIEEPSLDEVFMHFYQGKEKE